MLVWQLPVQKAAEIYILTYCLVTKWKVKFKHFSMCLRLTSTPLCGLFWVVFLHVSLGRLWVMVVCCFYYEGEFDLCMAGLCVATNCRYVDPTACRCMCVIEKSVRMVERRISVVRSVQWTVDMWWPFAGIQIRLLVFSGCVIFIPVELSFLVLCAWRSASLHCCVTWWFVTLLYLL